MIELIFKILAGLLGCVAIYFLWLDPRGDYAFAAVVLTISAAFLSYRSQIKDRIVRREAEATARETAED